MSLHEDFLVDEDERCQQRCGCLCVVGVCSVLQCVAVCSSVLQCVAVRCSVLHRGASLLTSDLTPHNDD